MNEEPAAENVPTSGQRILKALQKDNAVIVIAGRKGGEIVATLLHYSGLRITGAGESVREALHNLYDAAQ